MPRREDVNKILLIGSGPIVIGQACEFDYSGTQGAKALREEGYEVVLVNSNPATIMTDPDFAQRTYIEPLVPEALERIIEVEKPDALLPTLGGQTALNLTLELERRGVLTEHSVLVLGARTEVIHKAEDRQLFKEAMERIGLQCPRASLVRTLEEAREAVAQTGFPAILRPSFTLGGAGGGIVYNLEEFEQAMRWAFQQSPTHECLVEESVLGWKEFELEVIRDCADNFAVICTIENVDPMGVHTGDSVTVAPAMTLTDREYQQLRDAARAIISEVGVDTGGSNIQFAVNPQTGRFVIIEMNPRVSRSSALASKATGYPIAKIAAKLAVGYRLDELRNDLTQTSAAFEPTIDYVVCKWPRFAFEKFPGADPRLTTQMKSVGEVMAMGRTFQESFQKAAQALENGREGWVSLLDRVDYRALADQVRKLRAQGEVPQRIDAPGSSRHLSDDELREAILAIVRTPLADRFWYIGDGLRKGLSVAELHRATEIDPWFLRQLHELIQVEARVLLDTAAGTGMPSAETLALARKKGFSARQLCRLIDSAGSPAATEADVATGCSEVAIRAATDRATGKYGFLQVDTCGGEFPAHTPYFYAALEQNESQPSDRKKIMILGGGPNRIGQGIEFDYCCVHAAFALREMGYETIMVNCNPETVSTDYDTSDRLYFEPLTLESVCRIAEHEKPVGIIVQLGGQTPINLALDLERAGLPVTGTPAAALDRAEDREKFEALLTKLNLRRPAGGIAHSEDEAYAIAERVGYPVVVRPSYVLGGRGMEVVDSRSDMAHFLGLAFEAARDTVTQTVLVDHFLRDAIEVDVDCISDGEQVFVAGIMQHIEEAGIHSGDSAVVLPAHALPLEVEANIRSSARALALELGVVGLMNVQFAVRGSAVFVIEVNPRASRTIPFVSKTIGQPLAKIAAQVMAGRKLKDFQLPLQGSKSHVAVKESVLPFGKFAGVDPLLGPEMRSTGEVMGIGATLPEAFYKALLAAGTNLPETGKVFVSVRDDDKPAACDLAQRLTSLGFRICATEGTAKALARSTIQAETVFKVAEGRPHVVDHLRNGDIHLVFNTTQGAQAIRDSKSLRRQTLLSGVPYFTTMASASAAVAAIEQHCEGALRVQALQDYHPPCVSG